MVRKRVAILFYVVLLAYVGLAGRLAFIQFVRGEFLREQALNLRMRDIPVEAKRGVIYDRLGRELAVSVNVESVFAFPSQVKEPESTAAAISSILDASYDEILTRLTRPSSFTWIKRKIDDETARELKALRLPGIEFTQESQRFYPKSNLASHVLGISGIDSQGLEGVEFMYDKELKGVPGRIIVEFDAKGRELPQALHKYVPPDEGNSPFLTIDEVIQFIAERELEKLMVETAAKAGSIVILDPKTGDILALANRPDYDPNDYANYPSEYRRNLAVNDAFPPGSTFKPITAAAALEEGVVKMTDRFYCGGSLKVGDRVIHCHKVEGHGSQTFLEVIENSCNVGFMLVAQKLGKDKFHQYLVDFGLTRVTGVDLPGEARGLSIPVDKIKPVDLAVMAFGQTLTVTPIQMAVAVAAIANDGLLMKPRLLREIRSSDGTLIAEIAPEPVRQVISRETAEELRLALEHAVVEGTGRGAQVEGYRLAGKTGTAQKVIDGRIAEGKYIASFAGFGPVEDPRVVTLVFIDEPAGAYYGGVIAAPVFSAVMADVLRYLEVPRKVEPVTTRNATASTEEVEVPDVLNMSHTEAQRSIERAGLVAVIEGAGDVVFEQEPEPCTLVERGSRVFVHLAPAVAEREHGVMVVVPQLQGMTIREAADLLSKFGLRMATTGSGYAVSQQPVAGTLARPGSVIDVRFGQ